MNDRALLASRLLLGVVIAAWMVIWSHAWAITGTPGNDILDGGNGIDTAAYDDSLTSVTVDLNLHTAIRGTEVDTLTSIERIYASDSADTLIGDAYDKMGSKTIDFEGFLRETSKASKEETEIQTEIVKYCKGVE